MRTGLMSGVRGFLVSQIGSDAGASVRVVYVPPQRALDGPHPLPDEEWITHDGGWRCGIALLPGRQAREPHP